ncbi:P-loop containing nucleoside triphosphate hydrolase protein [Nemania sp. FL0916]|nr:P-loop containing nucleoside triphosphate hydrolase protein [Nemania sp. FL0916]
MSGMHKGSGDHPQANREDNSLCLVDTAIKPAIGAKRKNAPPNSSAERKSKRIRKPTVKELNNRKSVLGKQFENIFDWDAHNKATCYENIKDAEEQRKNHEKELEEALCLFGDKIERESQEDDCARPLFRVKGMNAKMRDYQVVGAAFMVRQERLRNDHRGSIIADEMGIGKTVQAIACFLAHPPSKKAETNGQGCTLIIAPNQALLSQWIKELVTHGNQDPDDICKYIGGGKMKARGLRVYPFLLTTYAQVETDFRSRGALFDVEFYRIILDEGDNIKNRHGSTSKACASLKASVRHVLTGTPLRNNVQESLPYFRFLRIQWKEDVSSFEQEWGKLKEDSELNRTMQILAHRMLRREAGQLFNGREVCKLPKSHFEDKLLSTTNEEAVFYKHLEQALLRREMEAREALRRGDPNSSALKANYRLQCSRLRQAVDHLFLLEGVVSDVMEKPELEALITDMIKNGHSNKSSSSQYKEPRKYDVAMDMAYYLKRTLSLYENDGCIECFGMIRLQRLQCDHCICQSCYEKYSLKHDTKTTLIKCPRCGKTIARMSNIGRVHDARSPSRPSSIKLESQKFETQDGRSISVVPSSQAKARSPGDDYNGIQPRASQNFRWLDECDRLGPVFSSTKTNATLDIIKNWQSEAPDDKIVVFVEWLLTARILGRMLNEVNVNFVYYNGHMSPNERTKNMEDFKENGEIKVMVATMSAGNVGLNITSANRMIIVTRWWNYASELQAFGRIKRHGQTKETHLVRLFARSTIDERVRRIQNEKEEDIKEAIRQGGKPKPLSLPEKLFLMGKGDANESPYIDSGNNSSEDHDSDSSG